MIFPFGGISGHVHFLQGIVSSLMQPGSCKIMETWNLLKIPEKMSDCQASLDFGQWSFYLNQIFGQSHARQNILGELTVEQLWLLWRWRCHYISPYLSSLLNKRCPRLHLAGPSNLQRRHGIAGKHLTRAPRAVNRSLGLARCLDRSEGTARGTGVQSQTIDLLYVYV